MRQFGPVVGVGPEWEFRKLLKLRGIHEFRLVGLRIRVVDLELQLLRLEFEHVGFELRDVGVELRHAGEYFLGTTTDNDFNGFSMYSSKGEWGDCGP